MYFISGNLYMYGICLITFYYCVAASTVPAAAAAATTTSSRVRRPPVGHTAASHFHGGSSPAANPGIARVGHSTPYSRHTSVCLHAGVVSCSIDVSHVTKRSEFEFPLRTREPEPIQCRAAAARGPYYYYCCC